MHLSPETAGQYARRAFADMLAVADRLGDALVNERPLGPETNAVAALVMHCCGVAEFWLGHVGLGRESQRAREAEFSSTADLAELRMIVDATVAQIESDLVAIDAGAVSRYAEGRQFLAGDDESDAALVLHVIEELYQHLGHCELAADALGPAA